MADNVKKAKKLIDSIQVLINSNINKAQFNKKKKAVIQSLNIDGTANVLINNELFENVEIRAGLKPEVGEVVRVEMPNSNTKEMYIDTAKQTVIGDGDSLHTHNNLSLLDTITQALIDAWNSAVSHISDAIKHITSDERNLWNTVVNKVDKIEGKGLSTEDYTTEEKNKLAGIEEGANKYIHPSTHPASMITESTSRRFVSDAEKSMWNSKAEISDIPTKVGQLENDKNYVTQEELESATYGSMVKSVYDKDDDGIVDVAETVIGNEIQLGNYKLIYNETTNSLDIEVVA